MSPNETKNPYCRAHLGLGIDAQLRAKADSDERFAQRVALACCALIETKADPVAAIRTTFRIQGGWPS